MTANKKQESNPRAVVINPLKLYNDLVCNQWLCDMHLTVQSSSCWTTRLLINFHSLQNCCFPFLCNCNKSCTPSTTPEHLPRSLHHSPKVHSPLTHRELLPTLSPTALWGLPVAGGKGHCSCSPLKVPPQHIDSPTMRNKAQMQGIQKRLSSSDRNYGLDTGISGWNSMFCVMQELRQDKRYRLALLSVSL